MRIFLQYFLILEEGTCTCQWSQLLNLSHKGNNNLKDGIQNLFRGPLFNATIHNFHDKENVPPILPFQIYIWWIKDYIILRIFYFPWCIKDFLIQRWPFLGLLFSFGIPFPFWFGCWLLWPSSLPFTMPFVVPFVVVSYWLCLGFGCLVLIFS